MAAWEILDIAWGRRDGDGALASDDSGGEGGPPPPVHPLAIEDGEVSDPYDPEGVQSLLPPHSQSNQLMM